MSCYYHHRIVAGKSVSLVDTVMVIIYLEQVLQQLLINSSKLKCDSLEFNQQSTVRQFMFRVFFQ